MESDFIPPLNKHTYNILLLGETGVGKSTFINAFYNYISFNSLEEADASENLFYQIPSKFTITDANFDQKTLAIGNCENEVHETGASVTRGAKSYVFESPEGVNFRLIDTPGVGDTRGPNFDKYNFESTMEYLAEFVELHAICILLKPNDARITIMFEYCIKELLCRLENSASQNIIFVFTNSKGTSYRPGETLPSLKKLLETTKKQAPYVEIPLKKDNVFCFDNEIFRYLLASKNEIYATDEEKAAFKTSWNYSSKECERMLEYIKTLKPHQVQNTISVNEARRHIIQLREPLIQIEKVINDNIESLINKKLEVQKCKTDLQELKKAMCIPALDVVVKSLDAPRTVCTNPKCNKIKKVGKIGKIHYENSCCDPCYLNKQVLSSADSYKLMFCEAMLSSSSGFLSTFMSCVSNATWSVFGGDASIICNVCGCHYSLHKHIYYELKTYHGEQINDDVSKQITSNENAKVAAEEFINKVEGIIEEYKLEKKEVHGALASFAHFLQNNVLLSYNDAYEQYINHAIKREENYPTAESSDNITKYKRSLKEYNHEKETLERYLESTSTFTVTAEEVLNIVKKLYKMKHLGEKLKEIFLSQKVAYQNEHSKRSETFVKIEKVSSICKQFCKKVTNSVKQTFALD